MSDLKQKSAAQMDAVYAAMLEELGVGRKDTLPLENKKGRNERVDLEALKSEVKINPFAAQWKNAKFDDVDPADLELDAMNDGQSHRKRMLEGLQATSTVSVGRGGYSTRGGRFGGRVGNMAPGGGRGAHQSSTRVHQDPIKVFHSLGSIFSHLDGASTAAANIPRGGSVSGIRGNLRGRSTTTKTARFIQQPRPNLSFNDRRSINELPITENMATNGFLKKVDFGPIKERSGNARPARSTNVVSLLASPEEFMMHTQQENTQLKSHTETTKTAGSQVNPHLVKEVTARHGIPTSAHQPSDRSLSTATKPPVTVLVSPPVILREISNSEREVVSEFACKIEKTSGIKRQDVQTFAGHARVVKFTNYGNITSFLEISDDKGRMLCQIPLEANIRFETGSQVITVETTEIELAAKWTMKFTFSWQCAKLFTVLLGLRPEPPKIPVTIASKNKSDGYASSNFNTQDTLISFSDDDDRLHHEALSSYTQELVGLLDDAVVDTTFVALNQEGSLLDQISSVVDKSKSLAIEHQGETEVQVGVVGYPTKLERSSNQFTPDTTSIIDLKTFRACGGGLMSSRYAVTATEVPIDKFMSSQSQTYQKLPKEMTKGYSQELSRRILQKVEQQTTEAMPVPNFDDSLESSAVDKSQLKKMPSRPIRVIYTADEMKEWRSGAYNVKGRLLPSNWVTKHAIGRENSLSTSSIDFLDQESSCNGRYWSHTPQSVDKSESVSSSGSQKQIDAIRVICLTNNAKLTATPQSASASLLDSTREPSFVNVPKRGGLANSRYAPKTSNTTTLLKSDRKGDKSAVGPQGFGNVFNSKGPLGAGILSNSLLAIPAGTGEAKSQNIIFDHSNTTPRPTASIPVNSHLRSVAVDMKDVDIGMTAGSNMTLRAETPLLTGDVVLESISSAPFAVFGDDNKISRANFPVAGLVSPLEGGFINDSSISKSNAPSDGHVAHETALRCASSDASITSSSMRLSRSPQSVSISTNVISPPTILTRRDSSVSLNSKRSVVTVKTCKTLQGTTYKAVIPELSTHRPLAHRHTNSDASSASFATAAEGVVSDNDTEFAQPTSNHLDFVEVIGADIALISPHHGNISNIELSRTPAHQFNFSSRDIKNLSQRASTTTAPVSSIFEKNIVKSSELNSLNDFTDLESLTLSLQSMRPFAPFEVLSTSRLGKRPGLSASRWATDDAKETGPKSVTRSHEKSMDSNSNTFNRNPGGGPFDIADTQPPHSQCMTAVNNDTGIENGNPIPTQTVLVHHKPIYQTVLVEDELNPGNYKEVRGMVKLGSVPIVAHDFLSPPQPMVHCDLLGLNIPTSSAPFIAMASPTNAAAINASNPATSSSPAGYFPSPAKSFSPRDNKLSGRLSISSELMGTNSNSQQEAR